MVTLMILIDWRLIVVIITIFDALQLLSCTRCCCAIVPVINHRGSVLVQTAALSNNHNNNNNHHHQRNQQQLLFNSKTVWGVTQLNRGGSTVSMDRDVLNTDDNYDGDDDDEEEEDTTDAYAMLAKSIQSRFRSDEDDADVETDVETLVNAFRLLSSSHKAFKGLDGAAHEAYQRTRSSDDVDLTVAGRAKRSAARTAAVALGLGACELCELITYPERFDFTSVNGTLCERTVLLNVTNVTTISRSHVDVLVLYEASYRGGAGIRHGSIEDLTDGRDNPNEDVKGRVLIIIGDGLQQDLNQMLKLLEQRPRSVSFGRSDRAAVQSSLYKAAGSIVKVIGPILQSHNTSAIHFVGRAMSGGIATLAAIILDGAIPMPKEAQPLPIKQVDDNHLDGHDNESNPIDITSLQGLGRGRVSAMVLGTPPCLSPNVGIPFVTSILYGDDIIGRASPDSLDRFYKRTRRAMQQKSLIGKKLNWMSDAATMATSNIQAHVFSGKDKDRKLVTPGVSYLIRPRRLGNQCSMHEIGSQQLQSTREALRAAILWQLNDILLSRSIWKHHQLESYIHGIDRVHLRGLLDDE